MVCLGLPVQWWEQSEDFQNFESVESNCKMIQSAWKFAHWGFNQHTDTCWLKPVNVKQASKQANK